MGSASDATGAAHFPAAQQRDTLPSAGRRLRKRSAADISRSDTPEDVEDRSRSRGDLRIDRESAEIGKGVLYETHIPIILERLAKVERQLEMSQASALRGQYSSDIASMRSILSPSMQGSAEPRSHLQLSSQSGTTPIYNDEGHGTDLDAMDSLSLRRNLSPPESPPFGVWWSYTIEETLVWPILQFHGSVNVGLDVLMDSSDEGNADVEDDSRSDVKRSSLGRESKQTFVDRDKRGLDDGIIVQELVESFLRNVHTKNPILDSAQLQLRAANLVENGLTWDGETCQVLLACALGAISYPWDVFALEDFSGPKTSPERYSIGQEYFSAAQKRLGALWSKSSLISAQCLFMTGVFFMYIQEPVAGWRAFNSASIACRSYISKRIARGSKGLPRTETRSLEQRLCWSCIKSEREVACEFGMETSGLNLIAYSTRLPTPPNGFASHISQSISAPSQAYSPYLSVSADSYEDQSWYYYLTEIMLRKLEMRIDIFFQDKRREAYRRAGESAESFFGSLAEALREFDFQLTRYYESLPPAVQFPLDDLTPCSDELRHYLRWRLLSVRHDICMPAIYILLHNDVSGWSSKLVAELVQLANICVMLDINFLKMAITTHRHHTTWLGQRKGVRSAMILIAIKKLVTQHLPGLEELYIPDDTIWEDGALALVKALQYWSAESRDCSTYLHILQQLHPFFQKSS